MNIYKEIFIQIELRYKTSVNRPLAYHGMLAKYAEALWNKVFAIPRVGGAYHLCDKGHSIITNIIDNDNGNGWDFCILESRTIKHSSSVTFDYVKDKQSHQLFLVEFNYSYMPQFQRRLGYGWVITSQPFMWMKLTHWPLGDLNVILKM